MNITPEEVLQNHFSTSKVCWLDEGHPDFQSLINAMKEYGIVSQREILRQHIKETISRIKENQKKLELEKKIRKELGGYEDCGSFYQDAVTIRETIISELVKEKISSEKWRKKLKYELTTF